MNSNSHGEVSRAMRNRCIEVCVMPAVFHDDESHKMSGDHVEALDALTGLWDSGVKSYNVGQYMAATHRSDCQHSQACHEDVPTVKSLKGWGALFTSLLRRGTSSPLVLSYQLLYEVHEHNSCNNKSELSSLGLLSSTSPRRELLLDSFGADIMRFGRLIRFMSSDDQQNLRPLLSMVPQDFDYSDIIDGTQAETEVKLRYQAVCRLLEAGNFQGIRRLVSFFDGHCSSVSSQIKCIALLRSFCRQTEAQPSGSPLSLMDLANEKLNSDASSDNRSEHLLEEALTYYQLDHSDVLPALDSLNAIALSYFINQKQIDASDITCPVTPLLFPLFQMIDALFLSLSSIEGGAVRLMASRDKFWQYLKRSHDIGIGTSSQLGVSFGGFLTHYVWLKKSVLCFRDRVHCDTATPDPETLPIMRQLLLCFESIERMIEESIGGSISSSDLLWKKGGHPVLPSSLPNFEALNNIQDIAKRCTLTNEDKFGFTRLVSSTSCPIDANTLVSSSHPSLYTDRSFLSKLLGALSTIYWATTDEIRGETLSGNDTSEVVISSVLQSFKQQESRFLADLNYATIDTAIRTVENALDLEKIKDLGVMNEEKQNDAHFVQSLVMRFGDIQTAQIGTCLPITFLIHLHFFINEILIQSCKKVNCGASKKKLQLSIALVSSCERTSTQQEIALLMNCKRSARP